jgi:nucleoside-diphosphate-sugar epimerase
MKVLLTGSFGNIGSHVIYELLRQEHSVRCYDLDNSKNRKNSRTFDKKIETIWGDIRDLEALKSAVTGMDAVIHLAAIIPPESDENSEYAHDVNTNGTKNIVNVCLDQIKRPKLLFSSTFDVYGHTLHKTPPRKLEDPVYPTDPYTEHKIECEKIITGSDLNWCIFRLSDVPIIGLRDPLPIMFEIGLDNRIEAMHLDDAALAITNALKTDEVWKKIWLVGGGKTCQVTYRDYLARLLSAMGIGPLPEEAFSKKEYATDWIDSEKTEKLLKYQRKTFDDIVKEIAACLGWKKYFVPMAKPIARKMILKMSPYYKKNLK